MRPAGRFWLAAGGLCAALACGVDTDDPAPYVDPPRTASACGTSADLFTQLRAFIGDGRFEPLRGVIEANLLPTEANPMPDPSWRSVVNALLQLIRQLGLERTGIVARLALEPMIEDQVGPLLIVVLEFLDGRLDETPRYEVADASAFFVDRCDARYLLGSVQGVLRLESPSAGQRWIVAVFDALVPLLEDPTLRPFIDSFENSGAEGRPAIVALLGQIMTLLDDEDFELSSVETLLRSVVYPLIDSGLEADIERLMQLLGEVTDPTQDVFVPLQQAMACGNRHPEQRDVLLGFVVDLVASPDVGLEAVLEGVSFLRLDVVVEQLDLLADVVEVLQKDELVKDELKKALVLFLAQPVANEVVPVLIDILEEELLVELLTAVAQLLEGCGRES